MSVESKPRARASTVARAILSCILGLVSLVATCAPASAASIAFIKAGNVWLAAPDGTGQRQVTTGSVRVGPLHVCVGVVLALMSLGSSASAAFAATTITVSSTAGTLGVGPAGQCTLRDALVVADTVSNPALSTGAEPGGSAAAGDCAGEVSGSGSP